MNIFNTAQKIWSNLNEELAVIRALTTVEATRNVKRPYREDQMRRNMELSVRHRPYIGSKHQETCEDEDCFRTSSTLTQLLFVSTSSHNMLGCVCFRSPHFNDQSVTLQS